MSDYLCVVSVHLRLSVCYVNLGYGIGDITVQIQLNTNTLYVCSHTSKQYSEENGLWI